MAVAGDTLMRYESSAGELSSPPSGSPSEPASPSRPHTLLQHRANSNRPMEQESAESGASLIPGTQNPPPLTSQPRQILFQHYRQPSPSTDSAPLLGRQHDQHDDQQQPPTTSQKRFEMVDGQWVQLTAAGIPRKKPGRKPGSVVKTKTPPETSNNLQPPQPAKTRKPRKPREPRDTQALPVPRKRKAAHAFEAEAEAEAEADADADIDAEPGADADAEAVADADADADAVGSAASNLGATSAASLSRALTPAAATSQAAPQALQKHNIRSVESSQSRPSPDRGLSPKLPKRENYPGSMQSILNAAPPSQPQPPSPSPSPSRLQSLHQQPLRAATTAVGIKSVAGGSSGPAAAPARSSGLNYDPIRGNYDPVRETISAQGAGPYSSSSGSPRGAAQPAYRSPSIASIIEPPLGPSLTSPGHVYPQTDGQPGASSSQARLRPHESASTSPSPSYSKPPLSPTLRPRPPTAHDIKKDSASTATTTAVAPALAPERPVVSQANVTTISNGSTRKASPRQKIHTGVSTPRTDSQDDAAQDSEARSILDFGKARPGEEMQAPTIVLSIPIKNGETNKYVNFMRMAEERYGWDALHPRLAAHRDRKARIAAATASLEKVESGRESGDEMSVDLSDGENSNPENGVASGPDAQAKPKKKRNFKEDQYDVEDDFVDDSELLWEAQAAASRDGFFVYSGPLVPEVEKPATGSEGPPKRGRGSRGGRGGRGAARGGAGGGSGGAGSRSGTVARKPRITKSEKLQREQEKAERESMAQLSKTSTNGVSLQPTTPSFTVSELGA